MEAWGRASLETTGGTHSRSKSYVSAALIDRRPLLMGISLLQPIGTPEAESRRLESEDAVPSIPTNATLTHPCPPTLTSPRQSIGGLSALLVLRQSEPWNRATIAAPQIEDSHRRRR